MNTTGWIATLIAVIGVVAGSAALWLGYDLHRATRGQHGRRRR